MSRFLAPAALVLLTLLAYANAFSTGFAFDNKALILDDTRVHAATAANLDLIVNRSYWWPQGESGLYRPLTTLSYLFNYAVLGGGERPAGYHAVNLLLHAMNVLLLYALARRVTGDTSVPFLAAALWAVHPLTTEAVTNIVGRADLLAAFGTLGALLAYVRSRDARGMTRVAWLAALAAGVVIAIGSKESGVVIVAAIALHELTCWRPRKSVGALALALAIAAIPLAIYFSQRAAVLGSAPAAELPFADNPIAGAGFWQGRLTAIEVIGRYLWLVIWPARLSADYSYGQIPLARTSADWLIVLAVVAVALVSVILARRSRALGFFTAFAFLTLLPASNLVVISGTIMAERLMYLPLAGLAVLEAMALTALAGRVRMSARARTAVIAVITCAIVGLLAVRTLARNRDWKDDVTLWSATAGASPDSAKAHHALAEALYESDPTHANIERVIEESARSLTIADTLPDERKPAQNYRQAAAYLLDLGDRRAGNADEAPLPPAAAQAYRGAIDRLQQHLRIVRAQTATRSDAAGGSVADADRMLAASYLRLREPKAALDAATEARALEPRHAVAYRAAAAALLDLDRPDDAAVMLAQGILRTRDASLLAFLIDLYRRGLDADGCAVRMTAAGPQLDPACATVRRHFCAADPGNRDFCS